MQDWVTVSSGDCGSTERSVPNPNRHLQPHPIGSQIANTLHGMPGRGPQMSLSLMVVGIKTMIDLQFSGRTEQRWMNLFL